MRVRRVQRDPAPVEAVDEPHARSAHMTSEMAELLLAETDEKMAKAVTHA